MTEDELKAIDDRSQRWGDVCQDNRRLVLEVRRLRGLLQTAADGNDGAPSGHCCNNCCWCNGENENFGGRFRHEDKCPAYTPEGQVR